MYYNNNYYCYYYCCYCYCCYCHYQCNYYQCYSYYYCYYCSTTSTTITPLQTCKMYLHYILICIKQLCQSISQVMTRAGHVCSTGCLFICLFVGFIQQLDNTFCTIKIQHVPDRGRSRSVTSWFSVYALSVLAAE